MMKAIVKLEIIVIIQVDTEVLHIPYVFKIKKILYFSIMGQDINCRFIIKETAGEFDKGLARRKYKKIYHFFGTN